MDINSLFRMGFLKGVLVCLLRGFKFEEVIKILGFWSFFFYNIVNYISLFE